MLPHDRTLLQRLIRLGTQLVSLHVLDLPALSNPRASYAGPHNPIAVRVGWSNDTIWLDAGKTSAREGNIATVPGSIAFKEVSNEVWDFHVGGYQVCHKWLSDRKGRTLSKADIDHYQKIIVAISAPGLPPP